MMGIDEELAVVVGDGVAKITNRGSRETRLRVTLMMPWQAAPGSGHLTPPQSIVLEPHAAQALYDKLHELYGTNTAVPEGALALACREIVRLRTALKEIAEFGHAAPGCGFSCGTAARNALCACAAGADPAATAAMEAEIARAQSAADASKEKA